MKTELMLIAQQIDETMFGWKAYYNPKNGKIIKLPDEEYLMNDEFERQAEEIDESGDFLCLPNQYEIHEYGIMRDFAVELNNEKLQNELLEALTRRHSYRNFKDTVKYYGIEELYYKYRFKKCYKLAKMWCEENSLDFIEDDEMQ